MIRLLPRSLRGRLTLALVSLTTVGLLLLAITTTLITTAAVTSVVEDKLASSMTSLDRLVERNYDDDHGPKKPRKPFIEFTSQASGTVIAVITDGRVRDSAMFSDDSAPQTLPPEAVAALEAKDWTDGEHCEFDIPGFGMALVQVRDNEHGDQLIAAVSVAEQRTAATWSTVVNVLVGLVTLVGLGLATIIIVRRETRPLERVAATADEVAVLPLDHGAVPVLPRLNEADLDDRTEAGRVAGAMDRMLEHVDHALATRAETDQRMRRFVTDASHELRTPLAAIQGYAELTRQESDVLPPLTEASLARIEAEASRMTVLVRDLLLLARLDEGQGGLARDAVDVGHLALLALSDAATVAPDWEWRSEVPDEPVLVAGDQSAITQIIANLLRNAHTHTPEGTSVTLVVHPPAVGTVEVRVRDTGPGVDPDEESQIFERFSRNDRSRSRRAGSTGLGLAIVRALAEAQGGTVHHERGGTADARGGATFVVRLPAWSAEAADPSGSEHLGPS